MHDLGGTLGVARDDALDEARVLVGLLVAFLLAALDHQPGAPVAVGLVP